MNVHFISIGGAVMHNMALALRQKGYTVSGSDDEIFEPALSRLRNSGILPESIGWFPEKIHFGLDAIILGMHARKDNPELLKAQEIGLKIYSFPEYMYEQTRNKKRLVVGGSHGKTTTTAMMLHVLKQCGRKFDYLVGSQLEGFDTMVGLYEDSDIAVFEGDEYLTSPIDLRPKFHVYHADVAIVTGIAWDHINVFPTFEGYVEQFAIFMRQIPASGKLICFDEDPHLKQIVQHNTLDADVLWYNAPEYKVENGITTIKTEQGWIELKIFGKHNLQNMQAARLALNQIGISDEQFYNAIASFKGTAKRLELLDKNESTVVYRDFAHSPSKVTATVDAVKDQFPERKLVAVFELHTFSSLNKNFLSEYKGALDKADVKIVYFNPHTLELKRMEMLSDTLIKDHFGADVKVLNDSAQLEQMLRGMDWSNTNLLLMSSGNFNNTNLNVLSN
ncbi:MAG: peptidoglycan synthetase [Bacteroidia bacterium]|nr:peptidoglycan synthetase [Bacteroidia bacterium]